MSRIPNIYRMPMGLPLNWRDEVSGQLSAAVERYYDYCVGEAAAPTSDQISLLIEYTQHHINAPCWVVGGTKFGDEIMALKEKAAIMKTIKDIHAYIEQAMDLALDPF